VRHKLRALTLLGVITASPRSWASSRDLGAEHYVKEKVIGLNPDIVIFTSGIIRAAKSG
jgi:hypothetical protein